MFREHSMQQVISDHDWWAELEKIIPSCSLKGQTYRSLAQFEIGDTSLTFTGAQRDILIGIVEGRQKSDYERMAVYFADVLAASAYDLLSKKGTSKAERGRQLRIRQTALESLRANHLPPRPSTKAGVEKRLENILEKFQEKK